MHVKVSFTDNRQSKQPGPEVIKIYTQLSWAWNFFLLINVKMPTVVLTLMTGKNNILGVTEPETAELLDIFILGA